ncbi:MAG: DUF2993 domain-containing protein [Spirulina sp. SIO3F2]|nr:DUF2993 domain-containing protein [Spirulina sp. SIO3F2]
MFLLQNTNLGEQALNKIAEFALASQFVQSETLAVNVVTEPTLLAQGKLSALSIRGTELCLRSGLQIAQMDLRMGEITVNPLRALTGSIELVEPIQGEGKIVLNGKNLTRALLTDELRHALKALPDLEIDCLEGQFVTPQQVAVALHYWTPLGGKEQTVLQAEVSAQAPIELSNPHYSQGQAPSAQLTHMLLNQVSKILNLQQFELNGMTLAVQSITIANQRAEIRTIARMTAFPS